MLKAIQVPIALLIFIAALWPNLGLALVVWLIFILVIWKR